MMDITDPMVVADLIAELLSHIRVERPDGTDLFGFHATTTATGLIRVQITRDDTTTSWLLDIYADAGTPATNAPDEAP